MLEFGIRHKRDDTVKDGGRRQHPLAVPIERHQRLKGKNQKAKNEEQGVENKHGADVELPVLRSAVQPVFKPA